LTLDEIRERLGFTQKFGVTGFTQKVGVTRRQSQVRVYPKHTVWRSILCISIYMRVNGRVTLKVGGNPTITISAGLPETHRVENGELYHV